MSGVNEIRSTFLDYFAKNGHEIVSSSPLVPRNDPTLMFVNAGMVQFKNVFTGVESRDYSRAVTSQKCVRAGGKHNDLDNVGYTARHHTFFEMLGNFSFGDYFKDVAIELAWNLVTGEYGLPKDKLLVTVFSEDDEAYDLWRKIAGLGEDKIIRIPTSDNFWAMGDTGPCGPCSEIFFDHGDHIPGGPPGSPDEDGDRFIEIWNLVFMQFEQLTLDERVSLPKPSIDTGMGLERISAVMQGTHDNYETDMFRALIGAAEDQIGRKAEGDQAASFKVIADHLRASSFLIADGVLPSNEGRGYVLRRIMRRAMRHAELLGVDEPLMWKLVPALVREMGQAYPELVRGEAMISETLNLEEKRFRKTLERGLKILDEESGELGEGDTFSGEVAFKLYDTFGFPLDLTQDALRSRGIGVDLEAFNASMERQRAEARKAWAGSGEAATETLWFELKEKLGATEFLGYDTEKAEGVVTAIVHDGNSVEALKAGDAAILICNQTPFYGESGGQVGDRGVILTSEGAQFTVTDTQKKLGDLFVHSGTLEEGTLILGEAVELEVDHSFRQGSRIHHSATHLLHEALRQTLGDHVAQKGSLVEPGRLRFDFSHTKAVGADEMVKIETLANGAIAHNEEVTTRLMNVDEAIEHGAMALFGEKYGDEVRVVSMGRGEEGSNKPWSLELCGGTHVARTGDIGLLRVVSESAVASGVRRIEALAGEPARAYLEQQDERLQTVADILKVTPADTAARVTQLLEERKQLERQLAEAKKQLALGGGSAGDKGDDGILEVGSVKLLARVLHGISAKDLRSLIDDGKQKLGSGIAAVVGVGEDGKAAIAVGVTEDLTGTVSAVDLVRAGSAALGGKGGGGRADMAQAGGPDGAKADSAIEAIKSELASL
ncbi:MAG: alanine--tRNA ligase [Alphaproteobacteria bacterium]|nr:alanine--tRNA ligase [Alphaproteobacteria bacterium]